MSALANRSAARLASDDIPGAIEDCAATLALLGFEEAHTPSGL